MTHMLPPNTTHQDGATMKKEEPCGTCRADHQTPLKRFAGAKAWTKNVRGGRQGQTDGQVGRGGAAPPLFTPEPPAHHAVHYNAGTPIKVILRNIFPVVAHSVYLLHGFRVNTACVQIRNV